MAKGDDTLRAFDIDGRPMVDLEELTWNYRLARAFEAAWNLGFFRHLRQGPATADDVATACGSHAVQTERLLTLMAAAGWMFRQPDGRFRLTRQGRELCDPASPLFGGDGIEHAFQTWRMWDQVEALVRTGERAGRSPLQDGHRTFVMAMHDYSIRGRVQWLAGNVDLTGRRQLLDLGGGPGSYSIALCERFPNLRATIWDLPGTEPLATDNVARFGLSDRIDFQRGDFTVDDFGTGYDAALVSNVLHGPGTGSEQRLVKVAAAMEQGGLLLVQDFLLDDDRNGPLLAALFNINVGAYTVSELLGIIEAAGFDAATLRARGMHGNGLVTAVRR
jgi:hypothetical protein